MNEGRIDVKQALIDAAIELFGEQGFKATSTRMLVDRAGVNISAIPYYFRNKEGVYIGMVEYIIGQIHAELSESLSSIWEVLADQRITKQEAGTYLVKTMQVLAHLFIENKQARPWGMIVLREQFKPTGAYDILYERIVRPLHEILTKLVAKLTDTQVSDDDTIMRAHMLLGQVLIFLSGREALLRRLDVETLDGAHAEKISDLLCQQAFCCLGVRPAEPKEES